MGELYKAIERADEVIARKGLDPVKTRGAIGIQAGFLLAFVSPQDPDDPEKLAQLREACVQVLGEDCGV